MTGKPQSSYIDLTGNGAYDENGDDGENGGDDDRRGNDQKDHIEGGVQKRTSAVEVTITSDGRIQIKFNGRLIFTSCVLVPDKYLTDGGASFLDRFRNWVNDFLHSDQNLEQWLSPPYLNSLVHQMHKPTQLAACLLAVFFWPRNFCVELFHKCWEFATWAEYEVVFTADVVEYLLDCRCWEPFRVLDLKKIIYMTEDLAFKLLKHVVSAYHVPGDKNSPPHLVEEEVVSLDAPGLQVNAFFNKDGSKYFVTLTCGDAITAFPLSKDSPYFDMLAALNFSSDAPDRCESVKLNFSANSPSHAQTFLDFIAALSTADFANDPQTFKDAVRRLLPRTGALQSLRELANHSFHINMPSAMKYIAAALAKYLTQPRKRDIQFTSEDYGLLDYLYTKCKLQPLTSTCWSVVNVLSLFSVDPDELVLFVEKILRYPNSNDVDFEDPKSWEDQMSSDTQNKADQKEEKDAPDVESEDSDSTSRRRKRPSEMSSSQKRPKKLSSRALLILLKAVISKLFELLL
jgi:hypothetical protein